jgi:hypothetical protein
MRQLLDALIIGAVVAVVALWAGSSAGGSDSQKGDAPSTIQVGLGVRVDSDWISLNGTWSVGPGVREAGTEAVTHRLTIGTVPNLAGRARKCAAFVRAIRTTAVCVAKQIWKDRLESDRPEGN